MVAKLVAYVQFISKFPGSGYSDYARFQIADAYLATYRGIKKDQSSLFKAAENFEKLPGREKAEDRLKLIADLLIKHEEKIIAFYRKQREDTAWTTREEQLKAVKARTSPVEQINLLERF